MASGTDFHVEKKLNDVFYTFSEFFNKKWQNTIFSWKNVFKKKKEFTENSISCPISPNFTKNFQMASGTDFHVEKKLTDVFYTFSEFFNKKWQNTIFSWKNVFKKKKEFTENSISCPISPNFTKNFQMASGTDFHVEKKLTDVFYTFSEFFNKKWQNTIFSWKNVF